MQYKTLLLIGADPYVLRACRQLGVWVVAVESHANFDLGLFDAEASETILVEDLTSVESILCALRRASLHEVRYDGVLTMNELSVVTTAVLAEVLRADFCVDAQTAVQFRDKSVQKSLIRAAGIRTADSVVIEDVRQVDDSLELPAGDRFVLKPIAGGGAMATRQVRSRAEVTAAGRQHPERRAFLLEEHIRGTEWNIDGIVQDGELVAVYPGIYPNECMTAVAAGLPMINLKLDPQGDADRFKTAEEFARRCVAALGLRHGVFHLEAFYDETAGELVFGECGVRRGGGFIQEMIHCKYGTDMALAAVQLALRLPLTPAEATVPGIVGDVYLPSVPGTLMFCPDETAVERNPGVVYSRIELPVGSAMTAAQDTITRVGQVLLCSATEDELIEHVTGLLSWFEREMIVAPHDASPHQLRALQRQMVERSMSGAITAHRGALYAPEPA
ncbi:hypothetical protein AB0B78_26930 [Streptomyces sp. NPDC040724]|uniref:hypothetical protein n=1 Tax=Streptomyces sp. NPDC040724 TaxID=3155612 RepID=UPI0033D037E7